MKEAPAAVPLNFSPPDDGDELARAEVYGLLAQLFYAAPGVALLQQFQVAVTEAPVAGAFLERSWSELVAKARQVDAAAAAREFDVLFQGIGKPEVFLYGSFYLAGKLNEKPLVELRHSLRALGLERADAVEVSEDHIASVCEVMRYLIADSDTGGTSLVVQGRFFDAHLRPWAAALCDAVAAHPAADFYRAVARFGRDFFAVEAEGFDLLGS